MLIHLIQSVYCCHCKFSWWLSYFKVKLPLDTHFLTKVCTCSFHVLCDIVDLMKETKCVLRFSLPPGLKRPTQGVSTHLILMSTQQTELPLMLSQKHHNLSWPWALFCMITMGPARSSWLALLHVVPEQDRLHASFFYHKEASKSISCDSGLMWFLSTLREIWKSSNDVGGNHGDTFREAEKGVMQRRHKN